MAADLLLQTVVLFFCLRWFHRRSSLFVLPVVLVHLLGSTLVFLRALLVRHDYLDGLHPLMMAGAFMVLFWAWSTVDWTARHTRPLAPAPLLLGLVQLLPSLLLPLLVWYVLSTTTFKIGG